MKTILSFLSFVLFASAALAATAVKVTFTLNTTDVNGAPLTQSRYYYVYRPNGYPTTTPLPMVLIMEANVGGPADGTFNNKSAQAGFVVVTGAIPGNSKAISWVNDYSQWVGPEDYDYTTEVINRVKASDNCKETRVVFSV